MKRNWVTQNIEADQLTRQAGYFGVGDALANNARNRPDHPAVLVGDKWLTFAQLDRRVNRLANALMGQGLVRGDRVAVLSENRLEFSEIVWAASKTGMIVPGLNWRLTPQELKHCLSLTTPRLLVASASYRHLLEEIRYDAPFVEKIVWLDDPPSAETEIFYRTFMESGKDVEPAVLVHPEDILTIIFTSGTTGYPKAAAISHRAIFARCSTWVNDLYLTRDDAFVGWSPMFHMASMDQMLVSGILGSKFIPVPGFDPEIIAQHIYNERLGWLPLAPGTYERLIEVLIQSDRKPAGLKYIGSMADMVPPNVIAKLTRLVQAPFLNSFGSTETGMPPATGPLYPVGKPPQDLSKRINTNCRIRLVDDNDRDVAIGNPGELILRGPTLFSGYWKNEAANLSAFREGWFHMGDVFTMNTAGKIQFVDRKKYMIKSGGENIYPAEIENALKTHPAVVEAVVVKKPDARWGEVPRAYVTVNHPVEKAELMNVCKTKLARYKKPREIIFVSIDDYPRSPIGKILRHEMEKW